MTVLFLRYPINKCLKFNLLGLFLCVSSLEREKRENRAETSLLISEVKEYPELSHSGLFVYPHLSVNTAS